MSDPVAALYETERKLSSACVSNNAASELHSFVSLVSEVKSKSAGVRQLSADLIPRFLHYFPSKQDEAVNAQLDLLEDEESAIRIRAIRGLEEMCRNTPALVARVTDPLAQTLVVEEPAHEHALIKQTLNALFSIDARAAFTTLLDGVDPTSRLTAGALASEDQVSLAIAAFLRTALDRQKDLIKQNSEVRTVVIHGLNAVLTNDAISLAPEVSQHFIDFLSSLLHLQKADSKDEQSAESVDIASILLTQAGLKKYVEQADASSSSSSSASSVAFVPENRTQVKQFISSLQSCLSPKLHNIDISPFVTFFFRVIVPVIDRIAADDQEQLFKLIAVSSKRLQPATCKAIITSVVDLLKHTLKLPDSALTTTASSAAASTSSSSSSSPVNFVHAEATLFLFHQVSAKAGYDACRTSSGLFIPTGQPTDFLQPNSPEYATRQDLLNRFTAVSENAKQYTVKIKQADEKITQNLTALRKQAKTTTPSSSPAATSSSSATAAATPASDSSASSSSSSTSTSSASSSSSSSSSVADQTKVMQAKLQSLRSAARTIVNLQKLVNPLTSSTLHFLDPKQAFPLSWQAPNRNNSNSAAATNTNQRKPAQQQRRASASQKSSSSSNTMNVEQSRKRKSDGAPSSSSSSNSNKRARSNSFSNGNSSNTRRPQSARNNNNNDNSNRRASAGRVGGGGRGRQSDGGGGARYSGGGGGGGGSRGRGRGRRN